MKGNERIVKFIELQNKDIKFEDISKEIGVTPKTLRSFLNKNGYKLDNGKYKQKDKGEPSQIVFTDIKKEKKLESTSIKSKVKRDVTKKEAADKTSAKKVTKVNDNKKNTTKSKKDKKINVTMEDMDKLCEVYDWYLQVRDYKSLKPKKVVAKKDINVENTQIKEFKNTSIKIEKETWEEFERLCSNSNFSKQEIFTQALKDFMKEYKHLL